MDGSQPFDPGSIPGWRTLLKITTYASMAEWSKALDLSSSIRKNAQVRTLLEAFPSQASVAQLAARRIHSPKVEGSTPSGGTFLQASPRGLMDKA